MSRYLAARAAQAVVAVFFALTAVFFLGRPAGERAGHPRDRADRARPGGARLLARPDADLDLRRLVALAAGRRVRGLEALRPAGHYACGVLRGPDRPGDPVRCPRRAGA